MPQVAQPDAARVREADVAIIGGGICGSAAAVVLGRAGYRVALIDLHAVFPPEFKAEKIAGDQIELLQRLQLFGCLARASTRVDNVVNARFGRVIDRGTVPEYGITYEDMVNTVRAQMPRWVDFTVGRVADIEASDDRQVVTLSNGERIGARLVILASGVGEALRQKLGIARRVIHDNHSLCAGFSILPEVGTEFPFTSLTYYGDDVVDRMGYISVFPLGGVMRANLFCYRDVREPWTRGLSQDPHHALYSVMPGLERFLGKFRVLDKVQLRVVDLHGVANHRRAGVVLLGDAFQTTCPATGTGISKVLTDIDRLSSAYLPRWLATPGMGAEKIAQFYDDPVKRSCDARALHWSEYRRSVSVDPSLGWGLHRWRVYARRRMVGWIGAINPLRTA